MVRSLMGLVLVLASSPVLAVEPTLAVRLPEVQLREGDAVPRYGHGRLVLLAHAFAAGRRLPLPGAGPVEPAEARTLVFDDGRLLWVTPGGWRTGFVPRASVAGLLTRLNALAPAALNEEHVGPDATSDVLVARLGPGRYARLQSWHLRAGPGGVATAHGLVALEGRDPAAVLAAQPVEYQRFLKTWQALEAELAALVSAVPASAPAEPTMAWRWVKGVPATGVDAPSLELKLKWPGVGERWQFLVEAGGKAVAPPLTDVAALEALLSTQRPGTQLKWAPGCKRIGGEPLLDSPADLKRFTDFCDAHDLEFTLVPGG